MSTIATTNVLVRGVHGAFVDSKNVAVRRKFYGDDERADATAQGMQPS